MSGPLVSIVMPSFNQGLFIGESVRSVLSQSHANLELVVMDGGSTDETHAVLAAIQSQDARLRWFAEPDNGPAQALNRALDKARGTLVGWLNSDDLYTPGAIGRAVQALDDHPDWLMVYGQGEHVDAHGGHLSDYPTRPADTPATQFAAGCFICQPTVFFRRTMWVLLGPLDEALRTAFDFDYWLRAFTTFPDRIGFIDQVQAQSRLHDQCITLSQKRTVSLESMELVSRHLGHAPAHWLLSCVDEMLSAADPPLRAREVEDRVDALLTDAGRFVPATDLPGLRAQLRRRAGLPETELAPADGLTCPYQGVEVRALILLLRDDLRERLQFWRPDRADEFRAWLLTNGVKEYPGLLTDPGFVNDILAPSTEFAGLSQLLVALWHARPDLRKAFPLPAQAPGLTAWLQAHGLAELGLQQVSGDALQRPASPRAWRERPFGVNLFGHVFSQFGVGEDVRMAAQALEAAGVPFALIDVPPGPGIAQGDRSLEHRVGTQAPYAFNLFCMAAPEHARYRAMQGTTLTEGRYNIGYWPWELALWPAPWQPLFGLVDEVWASSRHTLAAVQAAAPSHLPCRLMPMAVAVGDVADHGAGRAGARRHFGLPPSAYLFCFAFDLNSSIHRKNPQACVDAFLAAFPAASCGQAQVGLVIKVQPPSRPHAAWQGLKALAEKDDRLHIIEATLPRPELMALYACCDCFVSLHRAEGFGRGMAEALLLGLQVVATGYSGNIDFCHGPQASLVPFDLHEIANGQYPFGDGQVWADVSPQGAAESLVRAVAFRNPVKLKAADFGFPPIRVGQKYLNILIAIYEQ